jgi:hypothetical protein
MLLTKDELEQLSGYKTAAGQVKWLRDRGWRFEVNRLGQPQVDRDYYRQRMGVQTADTEPADIEFNWD